jgi:hypothetical protein
MQLEVGFGDFRVDLSPSDVVMSSLRLTEASDCIPHPYDIYTKCFSTLLICYKRAYGSTLILTLLHTCTSGWWFLFFGVDLSLIDVVMSWLRLQQASDWTPHPYWMYTKCFDTLIWCE